MPFYRSVEVVTGRELTNVAGSQASDQPSYVRAADLPSFDNPPVTEVSMGIQLQAVGLRVVDLGSLYEIFRGRYPVVEEHPPASIQVEGFGQAIHAGVQFQILERPPLPMLVLFASDKASLIQVQRDRFFCAWRRLDSAGEYPRYESLRRDFLGNLSAFAEFVLDTTSVRISPVQAEITYVNDVPFDGRTRPDLLTQRLPTSIWNDSTSAVPDAVTASAALHYTFKNDDGLEYSRLHIASDPMRAEEDQVIRLALTYRGEPQRTSSDESPIASVMRFLDEGHDQIVREFTANTTPEFQKTWRRVQ